jgi:hypothetical protein
MKVETEFERRLLEILAEYPDIDPEQAALALKGQPDATNEQIAAITDLCKFRPEEAYRGPQKPSPELRQMLKDGLHLRKLLAAAEEAQETIVEKETPIKKPLYPTSPTIAEYAFLALARRWYADVEENTYIFRSADILALSCLLLSVEWGQKFTDVARERMETNRKAAEAHGDAVYNLDKALERNDLATILKAHGGFSSRAEILKNFTAEERRKLFEFMRKGAQGPDALLWELCQVPFMRVSPPETVAVEKLTVNLDHHESSTRYWMMEIGWIARSWLAAPEAIPRLLKNLADTLHDPFEAAGLAASLASASDKFWTLASDFKPSDPLFVKQYADRLKIAKEEGFLMMQASFWELEEHCRKVIADAVLGLRLVPPGAALVAVPWDGLTH